LAPLGILNIKSIFISCSHECNANCVHCYEKHTHNNLLGSLATEEVKDIMRQFKNLGGSKVYFCSGEFLLRNDALELIKFASKKKLKVSVVTNGLVLNERLITKLKSAGIYELVVSIDSADKFVHDQLRGVKGCFEKAVTGLKLASQKGITTRIWTYVSKNNFNELEGVSKLGKKLGVMDVFTYFPLLSGHLFDRFDENLTPQERDQFRKKFNKDIPYPLLEFYSESSHCTGGGAEHICVLPTGDVTFCPPVPYSYGNIRSTSLRACLKRIIKDYKRFCLSRCTGQCIVNFKEYREKCNAKFIYK